MSSTNANRMVERRGVLTRNQAKRATEAAAAKETPEPAAKPKKSPPKKDSAPTATPSKPASKKRKEPSTESDDEEPSPKKKKKASPKAKPAPKSKPTRLVQRSPKKTTPSSSPPPAAPPAQVQVVSLDDKAAAGVSTAVQTAVQTALIPFLNLVDPLMDYTLERSVLNRQQREQTAKVAASMLHRAVAEVQNAWRGGGTGEMPEMKFRNPNRIARGIDRGEW